MMATGQWTFGLSPFGWRFSVALIGTVSILMTARIARRMTGSTMLGCVAGLLLALDGLELVLSRTAILDIFLMFWVLAAFGLLVIDRDRTKARLASAAQEAGPYPRTARSWASGGCEWAPGCAWARPAPPSGAGSGTCSPSPPLALIWDLGARRAAGFTRWLPRRAAPGCLVAAGLVRAGAAGGLRGVLDRLVLQHQRLRPGLGPAARQPHARLVHDRLLVAVQPLDAAVRPGPDDGAVLQVQPGRLADPGPADLLLLGRARLLGKGGCASEVLAIGTPLIWWGGALALLFCLNWWLIGLIGDLTFKRTARRDWRAGAVLLGVAAGWLPWIWFAWHDNRTEFYYYAVVFDPFLVIAITLCLGLIIGPARAGPGRRAVGSVAAGGYLVAALLNLAYLYPILTAEVIPYSAWLSRMWFRRWI